MNDQPLSEVRHEYLHGMSDRLSFDLLPSRLESSPIGAGSIFYVWPVCAVHEPVRLQSCIHKCRRIIGLSRDEDFVACLGRSSNHSPAATTVSSNSCTSKVHINRTGPHPWSACGETAQKGTVCLLAH